MTDENYKIVFVSPWNRKGGLATYSHYLISNLCGLCDIEIIPWDSEPIYLRGSGIPLINSEFISSAKEGDIVHVQYTFGRYLLSLPLLLMICNLLRTPVIITQHERFDNLPFPKLLYIYHQLLYFFVDEIVVHTEKRKEIIWKQHHSSVSVIEHGVIYRGSTDRQPTEIETILFPGGIRPIKRHDLAIRALAHLDEVTLRIVGGIGDDDYYQEIQKEATRLKVNKRVQWITEFISEEDLFLEFQNADLVLLPYETHTSMSGILSHCISWHVPALITDCPAFRHMISSEEVFLTERTGRSIAENIRGLNTNQKKQKMIIQEFEEISKRFSWENISYRTYSLYKSVIEY